MSNYLLKDQGGTFRKKWLYAVVFSFLFTLGCADNPSNNTPKSPPPRPTGKICDFERSPFIARVTFKDLEIPLEITFMGLHAKPDRAYEELQLLAEVYRRKSSDLNILLGDFNADCSYLSNARENSLDLKSLTWLIERGTDTNVSPSTSCAYDRIITDDDSLVENAGVSYDTGDVSDHYPVYATLVSGHKVAAFNLKRYGPTKASDSGAVSVILNEIKKYDLILLQEITSSSLSVLGPITPPGYAYVASEYLGSTSYKERYAYMYKTSKVEINDSFVQPALNCVASDAAPSQPPGSGGGGSGGGSLPPSCGIDQYITPGGYCYATVGGSKKRVANSCCNL